MNKNILAIIGVISVALVTFLFLWNGENNVPIENEAQKTKEMVEEYSEGNINNETASITSGELIVTKSDESQSTYTLPEDEFFVSIAPYVDQTHP